MPAKRLTPEEQINGATSHRLRRPILDVIERHEKASPKMIADELDAPLGVVSYHVRELHKVKLVVLTSKVPRRGAVEHYYRLSCQAVKIMVSIDSLKAALSR